MSNTMRVQRPGPCPERKSGVRAIGQVPQVEAVDLLEQFAEGFSALIDQALAFLRRCLCRVAYRAAWMKILSLPGERRWPLGGEPAKILLHRNGRGAEIRNCLAAYIFAISRQHDRRLN